MATVEPMATPRRGRPRSVEVDEAVLAATVELAGEVGVSRLSMDDVAVRAKVSKATIYRRWSSKEALVLDALRTAMSPIEDIDTGSLRGDLEHYFHELVTRFRSGKMRDVLPHLIGVACHDANLRCSLDDYMQTRRVPLREILQRGSERGELSADTDLDILLDVLIGPFTYRKLLTHAVIDEAFADKLLDLVLPNV
ncbi:MAG TPA: TetR/AcrR family transcriptional regulator [Ilumatobacteraceae bacterium]|nr:TetR/AcrR family transcriptional regulator [Ilumatobacteraceae bacterium]